MEGARNLKGWQWIFIVSNFGCTSALPRWRSELTSTKIEGSYTIATAVYFMITFPKSPDSPLSLTGIRWFTEEESRILQSRVLFDDPAKGKGRRHVSWAELKRTVSTRPTSYLAG